MKTASSPLLSIPAFKSPLPQPLFHLARAALEGVMGFPGLNNLYQNIRSTARPGHFAEKALTALGVTIEDGREAFFRVPVSGPVVIVANHPFGAVEGLALAKLLLPIRPDVKFMANRLLGRIPEMKDLLILVDPFGGAEAALSNGRPLRECLAHLRGGGCLVVFPAGEVSHWRPEAREVTDPPWSDTVARLVRRAGVPVLPVFIHGRNSVLFQLSGLAHPVVRTLLLGQEFLKQKGKTLTFSFGSILSFDRLKTFAGDRELTAYLRLRTYLLRNRFPASRRSAASGAGVPIVAPEDPLVLQGEVMGLPRERFLAETEEDGVFFARAREIPRLMREIGRLREMSFRSEGEGTGGAIDLDSFDDHYLHLVAWNKKTREVMGAYRLGLVDEILPRLGVRGLYTRGLFKYGRGLLDRMEGAIELGRSFVNPPYQKSFGTLLLLWQGVTRFCARNPRYRHLFGPVSISASYTPASRRIMMEHLLERHGRPDLARHVVPVRSFRAPPVAGWNDATLRRPAIRLEEVSDMVSDLETDRKGLPVLVRHYLKIGGKMLAFNVDAAFRDALDGLILVDLPAAEPKSMRRYMGEDAWRAYQKHHGVSA